jgi:hypothetical protein
MAVTRDFSFLLLLLALAVSPISVGNEVNRSQQLNLYMQAASASLAIDQRNALKDIKDRDRRNLAMTYYLRAADTIVARWSWNQEKINTFEASPEFAETLVEINKVARRFAADNPPYKLYVNMQVRSLEQQVRRWQTVSSVGVAAKQLRQAALTHLMENPYPSSPTEHTVERFRNFLTTWRALPPPTLAAPGLSLHGQGRAYDFQIQDKNGRIVAGPDPSTIASVWNGRGWTEKLSRAVQAESDKFVGPLAFEPWHYEYRP